MARPVAIDAWPAATRGGRIEMVSTAIEHALTSDGGGTRGGDGVIILHGGAGYTDGADDSTVC